MTPELSIGSPRGGPGSCPVSQSEVRASGRGRCQRASRRAQADPALTHVAMGRPLMTSCLSFCTCEMGLILKRCQEVCEARITS